MKLRLIAAFAAVLGAALVLGSPLAHAGGPIANSPQDHSWAVSFSTTAAGSHPDISVTLNLGTNMSPLPQAPSPTAFFDEATTLFGGLTPTAGQVGALVGNITFDIQSNVNPALIAANNIGATGQPPACGSASTLHLGPVNSPIYAAVKSVATSDPPYNTPAFPATGSGVPTDGSPFPTDQSPDTAHGGVPLAVRNVPDWWAPVLVGLGLPESNVVGRNYAIAATTAATHTSVNFLTINPGGGVFFNVTILANPIAAFSPSGQGVVTCPPFTSIVAQQGVSTAKTWNCSADYFGNPVASCGGTTTAASSNLVTAAAAGGPFPYQISLSSAANLDGDTTGGGVNLFGSWDNCDVNPNPTQSDANSNGIGDACKGGGNWANPAASAITNAGVTCGAISIAPPYNVCQDADQDGALNSSDNCPLTPNTDSAATVPANVTPGDNQKDSDRDGIGDACDPAINVPGLGGGYTGSPPYVDFDDTCNAPWSVGGPTTPASACIPAGTEPHDSNDNQTYDFYNPGAGVACQQDHASDSNNDGYSDSDQGTPHASATCTGQFPSSGGQTASTGNDPLKACAGRDSKGDAAHQTAAKKARADVNIDGNVNILDISTISGAFLQSVPAPTSQLAEYDQNGDKNVNILDISTAAGFFLQAVPPC